MRVSTKLKLTIWTSTLLVVMATILIALILSLSDNIIEANAKDKLIRIVESNANELEYDDGKLDEDDIKFYDNGVYTILYTEDGSYLKGDFYVDDVNMIELNNLQTTTITIDESSYYIFDMLSSVEDYNGKIWVRGIVSLDNASETTNTIFKIAFISMPLLIILGALGCYIIAKKTLKPINEIIKITDKISESEDLSLRIDIKDESSEIQELINKYNKMFAKLENSFEKEKQFTADVSHELRTPTAVILAQCEYALGQDVDKEEKEEALEAIQRQGLKMSKIIKELLDLVRLDIESQKIELKEINLSELILGIAEEQKMLISEDIKFTYDIEDNINGMFNETLIIRMVTNLLNNSYKYKSTNVEVYLKLSEKDGIITLSIKDNGIGIDKEHQDKIWNRFYQVDTVRNNGIKGNLGLGLAMVKQIVKIHHGKIELESELNKGSLFIITLYKNNKL